MNKNMLLLAGAGAALYLLMRKSGPAFYDMNGRPITDALCGSSATFDVPGYSAVWMQRLKNGVLDFEELFNLPMPAYVFSCSNDIGAYDIAVYEVDANGVKGKLIGQTSFTVHPQA